MQIEEFIERPAQVPAPAAAPKAQATPGSLRTPPEIEADLAELERRKFEAIAKAEALELQHGSNYQALLAGDGDAGEALAVAQAHAEVRTLMAACRAAQLDLAAARKRVSDEAGNALLSELAGVLEQRRALGDDLAQVLEQFCTLLIGIKRTQAQAVAIMNQGKRMVPVEKRQGVRVLDSLMQFADGEMLRRWVAMGIRHRIPDLFDPEEGHLAVRLGESVRNTNAQALNEMRHVLGIDEVED